MAEKLQIADYDYDLPPELIAQEPSPVRDLARLLVLDRRQKRWSHHTVRDLPSLLMPGDLLVVNDSRVLPARLFGRRAATGGRWEGLYLRQRPEGPWELLSQTRGYLLPGEWIDIEPGPLRLLVHGRTPEKHLLVTPSISAPPLELLSRHGHTPIPPYIRKGIDSPEDLERYQTVYAAQPGSVAAPTAGLHFTPELLSRLEAQGVERASVTLHVGVGTFLPLRPEQMAARRLHEEWCRVDAATVEAIARCRAAGRYVIAVGTTSARTLETVAAQGPFAPWSGVTNLFIAPPFRFRCVDALLTNFHLPKSSLLMLVCALAGRDLVLAAYREAVQQRYRFYSYGDAMLIL